MSLKSEIEWITESAEPSSAEQAEVSEEKSLKLQPDPDDYPDGGLQAWTVIFGNWLCHFCTFGWINCIGVFQDYYQTHQLRQYSPSTVSWITSLETAIMYFAGIFVGKLYDNYGPRYILLFGTVLHVFGLMMASLASEYYQFILSQGLCSAIGAACIFHLTTTTTNTWFYKRRSFAYGVVATGSGLGGVILPILFYRIIGQVGFPWTMRIAGFLILGLLAIANLTVRSRLPPKPSAYSVKVFSAPLHERVYVCQVTAVMLFTLGLFVPLNYIVVQARASGMSPKLATYLLPILNGSSLIGRIISGYIGDKMGRFNCMSMFASATGVLVLTLWILASSEAALVTFAAGYGFGIGAFVSLGPSLVGQITRDMSQLGVRTGMMYALSGIPVLAGNPIAGALITADGGSYTGLQVFTGVALLASASFYMVTRALQSGLRLKAKF